MGTFGSSIESNELTGDSLINSLEPYDEKVTEEFGPIKILKQAQNQSQKPFKYYMLYTENGIDDRTTLQRMEQKLSWYKSLKPSPHIVDIEAIKLRQKSQMCIKKLAIEIYTKYYYHSIEYAIGRKLELNRRFKEADVFYVFNCLLEIWNYLNDVLYNKHIDLFNLKNVFLSPEGYVKMYPFPIDLDFVSSPLRTKKTHSHTKSFLQHEELQMQMNIKRTEHSTNQTSPNRSLKQLTQKDNLKDIGLILFQMVLLNKEAQEVLDLPVQRQTQLLQQLQRQHFISRHLKDIMNILLSKYKDTTYEELKGLLDIYKADFDKPISTNIKLEQGQEFIEPKQLQKAYNLKRLSEHKNLKTGIISIMSKRKIRKE